MSATLISTNELKNLIEGGKAVVIIDTRLEDDFIEAHIKNAENFCVFESASVGKLIDAHGAAKEEKTFVVYGACETCHGSRHAQDKMQRLGFKNVLDYREGIDKWTASGNEVVRGEAIKPPATIPDGTRAADLKETRVLWTGRNLLNKHDGSLGIKSAQLSFQGGSLVGGEFVIDMNDIKCFDLAGGDYHDYLIGHLKNEDFFDVEKYPEASFKIESTSAITGATPGSPNLHIKGQLTIKGISQTIEFDAAAGIVPASGLFACQATFSFDRTKHNVLYGSSKFFTRLAGHVVNDHLEMAIRLVEAPRE